MEGGLNISGSGGVAAPTRPLNVCLVEGWSYVFWKTSIDRDLFVNRFCLQVGFCFLSQSTPVVFFFQGRNVHAMITFTEEGTGTLKQRIQETNLQQGFHSSRVASCYQVLRMLSNQTRDVKSRHDSFPLRAKVDETGQLLVLT